MGSLELSELVSLHSQLEKDCKTKQPEWEVYFYWHFQAFNHVSDSKIASSQSTIPKLTKAISELSQKLLILKETSKGSDASLSAPSAPLLPACPPSLYPSLAELPFSNGAAPAAPLEVKLSGGPTL